MPIRNVGNPRREEQRFCRSYGIPRDWPDDDVLARYVVRGRTLRVCAVLVGFAAGGAAAGLVSTSPPALAVYCTGRGGAMPPIFVTSSATRSVDRLRRAQANPAFVRAFATADGGGFTFNCAPPSLLGPQISTTTSDRKRSRTVPGAALGGLLAYMLATWKTDRRALRLAPDRAAESSDDGSLFRYLAEATPVRRAINPLGTLGVLGVLLVASMRSPSSTAVRIGFGVVAALFLIVSAVRIVRLLRDDPPRIDHQTVRVAALERRQLHDYFPTWLVLVGFAYAAWLGGLFVLSVTTPDLSDPLLWPSWKYEPAALVLLIGTLTVLSGRSGSANRDGCAALRPQRRQGSHH